MATRPQQTNPIQAAFHDCLSVAVPTHGRREWLSPSDFQMQYRFLRTQLSQACSQYVLVRLDADVRLVCSWSEVYRSRPHPVEGCERQRDMSHKMMVQPRTHIPLTFACGDTETLVGNPSWMIGFRPRNRRVVRVDDVHRARFDEQTFKIVHIINVQTSC